MAITTDALQQTLGKSLEIPTKEEGKKAQNLKQDI